MAKNLWNIAVIGATGAVGREMVSILEEKNFPVSNLRLFASERSLGETISFRGNELPIEVLSKDTLDIFEDIDLALVSAGSHVSKEFLPLIGKRGTICIDNSNAFRMDPEVPLIVPEVNTPALSEFRHKNIIANPNCSTIQMVQVLKPIHDIYRLKRVVVSTYQSTSGKGQRGIEELSDQTISLLNQKEIQPKVFPHQIAFNCIPHIDTFDAEGYTLEERKMMLEAIKILEDPSIKITATCVRVPTFSCHGESVNIETHQKAQAHDIRKLLSQTKGLKVVDDPSKNLYPTPVLSAKQDETFVGRIREDDSTQNGINVWIVSDNLRKGAALNAVQIAVMLTQEFL